MSAVRSLLTAAFCWLLAVNTVAGMFESLFGETATICTDGDSLGPEVQPCSCPREESRLYQGADCSRRDIHDLRVELVLPRQVPTVSFEGNRLTVVKQGQFARNPSVTKLRLSKNRLKVLERLAFEGLPALETLLLDHNQISIVSPEAFRGLSRLQRVDLGFNRIEQLDGALFAGTGLRVLQLHLNPLQTLPADAFQETPQLETLDLGNTDLAALPAGLFASTRRLTRLLLTHNQLTEVPSAALAEAGALEELDLSGNQLTVLPADGFVGLRSLRRLVVSSMRQLERVEAHAFSGLPSLEELLLQFCPALTELDPAAFREAGSGDYLERLVTVDLKENGLTRLSKDLLPWERMQMVDLEMNPWICDCELDWVAKGDYPFEREPLFKCEVPEAVAGRPVTSLKSEEFVCEDEGANIALIVCMTLLGVAVAGGLVFVVWKFELCKKANARLFTRPKHEYNKVRATRGKVELEGMEWDNKDIGV